MKKITLLFSFLVLMAGAFAQCTLDNDTSHYHGKYFYPDTPSCIIRNSAYAETIYMRIPKQVNAQDFSPSFPAIPITVDSIHIDTILGLPLGISYAINPPSHTVLGGGFACIYLSGTTSWPAGAYTLDFGGYGCGNGFGMDTCIHQSSFSGILSYDVFVCNATGISESRELTFSVAPNPAKETLHLNFKPLAENGVVNIFDVTGKLQLTQELKAASAFTSVDVRTLNDGIYFVEVVVSGNRSVRRFTISGF